MTINVNLCRMMERMPWPHLGLQCREMVRFEIKGSCSQRMLNSLSSAPLPRFPPSRTGFAVLQRAASPLKPREDFDDVYWSAMANVCAMAMMARSTNRQEKARAVGLRVGYRSCDRGFLVSLFFSLSLPPSLPPSLSLSLSLSTVTVYV